MAFLKKHGSLSSRCRPDHVSNAEELQKPENLGRLKTTTTMGDTDGDGDHDLIYGYGGRSFSIWSHDGSLVFDSGNAFEHLIAKRSPDVFNATAVLTRKMIDQTIKDLNLKLWH